MANLALLTNLNCFISTANSKFKNFQEMTANLGDTVSFDLPPRFNTQDSLVVNFQNANQRVQNLVCANAANVGYAFTSQEMIFNVEQYMPRFGVSATAELGAAIEANVAQNCVTAPFRFYGNGVTPINSYTQLASALAMFRNFGAAKNNTRGYLSDTIVPGIIGTGLQQFALDRNNEDANSWELGMFSNCEWYQSNLLPIHIAGSVGQAAAPDNVLTVVSTTTNADGGVVTITFSGAADTDPNSILQYDRFQFNDGVSGYPNLRFLTFIGHEPSASPVQFQATAQAASSGGGDVTVSITPALQASAGPNQNITSPIQAGMQVTVMPSCRNGMIISGDAFYLAMPRLPDQSPFLTANAIDETTGVSMRMYFGTLFGQNQQGMVQDCIWGSTVVPEYSMALLFPL